MNKSTLALLVTAFAFGFSTADVDAKVHHFHKRNHFWHNGKHYQHKGHHHKRHHRKLVHKAVPPIVVAHIYIGSQHMSLDVNGARYGDWIVSTGRKGFNTPRGAFRAMRMARVYFSRKYDNSPMPYSVFFHGGNAIHGTEHVRQLGRPASHGCVRLLPQHAAELYAMVERYGMARTSIVVTE